MTKDTLTITDNRTGRSYEVPIFSRGFRRPVTGGISSNSPAASSLSGSTATSRCGRCGSARASR